MNHSPFVAPAPGDRASGPQNALMLWQRIIAITNEHFGGHVIGHGSWRESLSLKARDSLATVRCHRSFAPSSRKKPYALGRVCGKTHHILYGIPTQNSHHLSTLRLWDRVYSPPLIVQSKVLLCKADLLDCLGPHDSHSVWTELKSMRIGIGGEQAIDVHHHLHIVESALGRQGT